MVGIGPILCWVLGGMGTHPLDDGTCGAGENGREGLSSDCPRRAVSSSDLRGPGGVGSIGTPWREGGVGGKGEGGGTNLCDVGMDLSGSWQQGHSATYNAPSRI